MSETHEVLEALRRHELLSGDAADTEVRRLRRKLLRLRVATWGLVVLLVSTGGLAAHNFSWALAAVALFAGSSAFVGSVLCMRVPGDIEQFRLLTPPETKSLNEYTKNVKEIDDIARAWEATSLLRQRDADLLSRAVLCVMERN